jgi:hypothetical protein
MSSLGYSKLLGLAVYLALHPGLARAAEEIWPETSALQPTARPIEAAGPIAPDMAPPSTPGVEDPLPPGEGPQNEIDVVTMGSGEANFWKPEIHAGLTTSVVFDDNIFITNQNAISDTIFVTSARATIAFGNVQQWASRFIDTTSRALVADAEEGNDNLIALSYSPTAHAFVDNDNLNSVEHDVAGTARWNLGKLKIAFDGRFQTLSDADEDLGRRTDRTIAKASLGLTYDWSEKTRIQLEGDFMSRDYKTGRDSVQFGANAYLLYDIMPKTQIGFGLGGGELQFDGGSSDTFERGVLRLRYNSYSKITLNMSGGAEWRQRDVGDDQFNGIFQVGIAYAIDEGSQIYFSAFRRLEPSANAQSQNIERLSFSLGYNVRLYQKLTLATNVSYSLADYTTPDENLNKDRSDNQFSISTTLSFEITANGFIRLGYAYRQNDSSREIVSYQDSQFTLSATALF